MTPNKVTVTCQHCAKPFEVHAYRLKNGTGKYCNRDCYMAERWKRDGVCLNCGEVCATRFCNPECQKSYWNKKGYEVHKKSRNWERKLEIIAALGGKCVKCGFDDYRALDINHINPDGKVRPKDGSYTWTRRFKDWAANMDNIELLCANCHRLHTWEQRDFGPKPANQVCNH